MGSISVGPHQLARLPSTASRQSKRRNQPASTAAIQIVREAVREGISIADLTRMAKADPAFALRVLSVTNSAAYARSHPITDIQQAASLLGIRGLRNVALGFIVTDFVPMGNAGELLLAQSLRRALSARAIAGLLGERDADGCFTAGLLLDSGLLMQCLEDLPLALRVAQMPAEFRVSLEVSAGERPHPECGAKLARDHHLPEETVCAILEHHAPRVPQSSLSRVCWLAEKVAGVFESAAVDQTRSSVSRAFSDVGLDQAQLDALLASLPRLVAEAAEGFQRSVGEQPDLDELRRNAHARIVQINDQLQDTVHQLERVVQEKDELTRQLRLANQELAKRATTDPLTELPNRRALESALVRDLARANREKQPLSFVVADVDHFKRFNDDFGHQLGDEVLRTVARVLMETARQGDMVARFGGEEFCIILPGADVEGGRVAAERFRAAIDGTRVESPKGSLRVTASFGVASFGPEGALHRDELFELADQALYKAKQAGRNCVFLAEPPPR